MRWRPLAVFLTLLLVLPAVQPGNHTHALADALVTCHDPQASGPLVSRVNGHEFRPTAEMCLASRALEGHVGRAAAVAARLARCEGGGGLQVTVFGGSVSCGRCLTDHKDRVCLGQPKRSWYGLECRKEAYPKLLEDALNLAFPCPRRHIVVNRCRSGSGSDFFVSQMGQYMKDRGETALEMADLVIAETSTNDVMDLAKHHKTQLHNRTALIQFFTEALVRQLLLLPKRPLLLYLHASWRNYAGRDSAPPYHNDAAHAHAHVLKYYHIPQVSAMAALQPLYAPARRDWLTRFYFCDAPGHPTAFGHQLLAALLLYNVRRDVALVEHLEDFDHLADHTAGLPPSLADAPKLAVYEGMMRGAVYEYLDLRNGTEAGYLVLSNPNSSFQFMEDVPNKPGLIAMAVGATLLLNLTHGLAPLLPHQPYLTTVGHLISYAHMGRATFTVVTLNGTRWVNVLAEVTVDFATQERVSIYQAVALPWTLTNATANATEVGLYVEALPSDPARPENKVKLLDVTTVCAV
eukprot:EG_transcript_7086